jgi:hypothetical protein
VYEYPDAGKFAPPEVQEAIERFRALPEREKRNLPVLWFLLGSSTQEFKMDPSDAEYQTSPRQGHDCANCDFGYRSLRWGVLVCSQIAGTIEPQGWCKLWERSKDSEYPY